RRSSDLRHLVEGHQLRAEAPGLLHGVGAHLDPGAGGLLVGDGHGQLLNVAGLDLGLVGGDDIVVIKGYFRKGVGQVFFIQLADHGSVLLYHFSTLENTSSKAARVWAMVSSLSAMLV